MTEARRLLDQCVNRKMGEEEPFAKKARRLLDRGVNRKMGAHYERHGQRFDM